MKRLPRHSTILAFLCCVALPSSAAEYSTALLRMEIPPGFEGPAIQHPEPGLKLVGYGKAYPDGVGKTLLLVTTYEYGIGLDKLNDVQRGEEAGKYLQKLLDGVRQSRVNFSATAPTPTRLGGVPAMRSEWRGEAHGRRMSGFMYCAVPGNKLACFHTQDFEGAPPGNRQAAVAAIEGVVFRKQR
jgi:hypothetical protein